jgi:O-antigen chain-terminating methyltransferase
MRSLRDIDGTRRSVETQTRAQEELREALAKLQRALGDEALREAAKQSLVRNELASLSSLHEAGQRELSELRELGARLQAALATAADAQRQQGAAISEVGARVDGVEARSVAANAIPRLSAALATDTATWLHAAFEGTFRGSRNDIAERLRTYVKDVRKAYEAVSGDAVDVGCGRGEWLELMRAEGIPARGVDDNALIVQQCRDLGLDVALDDAIAYLNSLPVGTLCAVTAFHLVEHLSWPRQLQLLAATHHALADGGVLVLETPNPENLVVGAWTFYMDPTHFRPLPPTLLSFMLDAAGFEVTDVRRVHPDDALAERAAQEHWPAGVRELLCGPRDVGFVARRRPR